MEKNKSNKEASITLDAQTQLRNGFKNEAQGDFFIFVYLFIFYQLWSILISDKTPF